MDTYQDYYHTEEDIIIIVERLTALKDMPLLNDDNEFLMVKDFEIKSNTLSEFNWFKARKEVLSFFIYSITIYTSDSATIHQDDNLCTVSGLMSLEECRDNYTRLEKSLKLFRLNNKTGLVLEEL